MGIVTLLDTAALTDPAVLDRVLSALPPARREKADRYRRQEDRLRSLAAAAALDWSLARAGLRLGEVTVQTDRWGKPYLADHPRVCFNLSHSGAWAVCALTEQAVGVDVETVRDRPPALVRRVCTPEEAARLKELTPAEAARAFTRLWTAKESCMKCLGLGLALDPGGLSLLPGTPPRIRPADREAPLYLTDWPLPDAFVTVCVARPETFTLHPLTPGDLMREAQ